MEFINQFILGGYIIIAVIASVVVELIKRKANKNVDSLKSIAMVVGISILLAIPHGIFIVNDGAVSGAIILTAIEQGILCGAIAVFGFDLIKSITGTVSKEKTE